MYSKINHERIMGNMYDNVNCTNLAVVQKCIFNTAWSKTGWTTTNFGGKVAKLLASKTRAIPRLKLQCLASRYNLHYTCKWKTASFVVNEVCKYASKQNEPTDIVNGSRWYWP